MSGLEVEGLDEVMQMFEDLTIEDGAERKALTEANNILAKEIESNAPNKTGKTKKLKKQVKKDGEGFVGVVKLGTFYGLFLEMGSSKSKRYVGFFDRAVHKAEGEVVTKIADTLLQKAFK